MSPRYTDDDWKWAQENPEQFKAGLRFQNRQKRAIASSTSGYSFHGARIGDLVKFSYQNAQNALLAQGIKPLTNRRPNEHLNPTVLVLHNNWRCGKKMGGPSRCFHGLNWDLLSSREQNYLRGMMNPLYAAQISASDKEFAARYEKYEDIAAVSITSPEDFYTKVIRPFIQPKNWEPYRRYKIALIRGIHVVVNREVLSGSEGETLYRQIFKRLDALRGPNF